MEAEIEREKDMQETVKISQTFVDKISSTSKDRNPVIYGMESPGHTSSILSLFFPFNVSLKQIL